MKKGRCAKCDQVDKERIERDKKRFGPLVARMIDHFAKSEFIWSVEPCPHGIWRTKRKVV